MSTVEILNTKDETIWDDFVKSHEFGQFYHTIAWKDVLENSFPHIRANCLMLRDRSIKCIEAALPLYLVKSRLIGNRLVSVPFGTLCDPLLCNSEQFKALLDCVFDLKEKFNCRKVELKIFKSANMVEDERLSIRCTHKHHYLNLDEDFEKITKRFKRTVRQAVRKAKESGLEVIEGETDDDLKAFYKLYMKTRKRNFVPSQPYRFFKNLWKQFFADKLLSLILVKKEGQIIGGGIVIKFKDRATLEFLASDSDFLSVRPNHLLAYAAIKSAHEEQYTIFDFGRTAPEDTGLMRFKKYWGTDIVDLSQAWNKECTIATEDTNTLKWKFMSLLAGHSPLPLYRILNNFCYRHLG